MARVLSKELRPKKRLWGRGGMLDLTSEDVSRDDVEGVQLGRHCFCVTIPL